MPLTPGQKDATNNQWGRVYDPNDPNPNPISRIPQYSTGQGAPPLVDSYGRVWMVSGGETPSFTITGSLLPSTLTLIPTTGVLIQKVGTTQTTILTKLYIQNLDTVARFLQVFLNHALPAAGNVPAMSIPINPQGFLPDAAAMFLTNVPIDGNNVNLGLVLAASSTQATYTALASPVMYYSYTKFTTTS